MRFYYAGEKILLTLWVGGIWAVGYIATPILFGVLDDRQLAGVLAGHMFTIISYFGLVCGGFLLVGNVIRSSGVRLLDSRSLILIVMLFLIIAGQFFLYPMMAELKVGGLVEGSQKAIQFGRLHMAAAGLYFINGVLGLALVVLGIRTVVR